jgi:hypothetical protein
MKKKSKVKAKPKMKRIVKMKEVSSSYLEMGLETEVPVENSATDRIDIQRLEMLNDRLCQTLEAISLERWSALNLNSAWAVSNLSHGVPSEIPHHGVHPAHWPISRFETMPYIGYAPTPHYHAIPNFEVPGYVNPMAGYEGVIPMNPSCFGNAGYTHLPLGPWIQSTMW